MEPITHSILPATQPSPWEPQSSYQGIVSLQGPWAPSKHPTRSWRGWPAWTLGPAASRALQQTVPLRAVF